LNIKPFSSGKCPRKSGIDGSEPRAPQNLARCRELLEVPVESLLPSAAQIQAAILPIPDDFRRCPVCLIGIMVRIARIAPLPQNSS